MCRLLHESRRHNPGARRKDVNGMTTCKFHQAFCDRQFGAPELCFNVPFGAHYNYTRTVLHFQTPDALVRLGAERVRQTQHSGQKDERVT